MVRDVLKAASANHYGCCTFRQRCIYLSSWQPPAQPKSNSGVKYDQSSKKTCLCVRTTLTLLGPLAASTAAYGYVFFMTMLQPAAGFLGGFLQQGTSHLVFSQTSFHGDSHNCTLLKLLIFYFSLRKTVMETQLGCFVFDVKLNSDSTWLSVHTQGGARWVSNRFSTGYLIF